MITLIIALLTGGLLGAVAWVLVNSWVLSIILLLTGVIGINFALGRYFMKKMTALMETVEKDLRSERMDLAIEKLKGGYTYSKWQFLVKKQLDSQIGSIYYIRRKFDEAMPYLKNSFSKNWGALAMLASHHYRNKDYSQSYKIMENAIAANKKEPFLYSLFAYFLSEQNQTDRAIEVLGAGLKKIPLSDRLQGELDNVRNRKKIKMQNYGSLWMQLHLGKSQDGAKPYQMHLMNQRFKRR